MRMLIAAVACSLALPVLAAEPVSACASDPQTRGLSQRIENIREQMDRIESSADPAEQRRLLDLHAKVMREGMREIRRREASVACRQELMHALIEQFLRHQVALQDVL